MDVMDGNCAITVCTLALDGRSVCAAAHSPLTVALLPGRAHGSRARRSRPAHDWWLPGLAVQRSARRGRDTGLALKLKTLSINRRIHTWHVPLSYRLRPQEWQRMHFTKAASEGAAFARPRARAPAGCGRPRAASARRSAGNA